MSSSAMSLIPCASMANGECWIDVNREFRVGGACAIGKFKWLISIVPTHDNGFMLYIDSAEENRCKNWRLKVELTLSFYADSMCNFTKKEKVDFTANNITAEYKFTQAILHRCWAHLVGHAAIRIHFNILEAVGLRLRTTLVHDFTKPCDLWNFMLIIGEQKVFVDIHFLATYSHYFLRFKNDLDGQQKDPNTGMPFEVLHDIDYSSFLTILRILYPENAPITANNIAGVLKVADYLMFETVLAKCEDFLLNHPTRALYSACQMLDWAFTYQMADLQHFCLGILNSIDTVRNDPFYEKMSVNAKEMVWNRILSR